MPAWRVREIAEPKRWNAKTLSEATQLAYGTVYSIWTNKATRVDFDTLYRIAFVLGVGPADLFGAGKIWRIDPPEVIDGLTYNAVHETGMGDAFLTYVRPGSDIPTQPSTKYFVPAPDDWEERKVEEIK